MRPYLTLRVVYYKHKSVHKFRTKIAFRIFCKTSNRQFALKVVRFFIEELDCRRVVDRLFFSLDVTKQVKQLQYELQELDEAHETDAQEKTLKPKIKNI